MWTGNTLERGTDAEAKNKGKAGIFIHKGIIREVGTGEVKLKAEEHEVTWKIAKYFYFNSLKLLKMHVANP